MKLENNDLGVNIIGLFTKNVGLGIAAKGNVAALNSVGIKTNIINFDVDESIDLEHIDKYNINFVQINPDWLKYLLLKNGKKLLENKYNIAFWAWELSEFPDEYASYFDLFDEIWTPSKFCQDAISKKSPISTLCFPHAITLDKIETDEESIIFSNEILNEKKGTFIFTFFFDFHSLMERKNLKGLIESFHKAFGKNNKDVTLIIKCNPTLPHEFTDEKNLLNKWIDNDSSIIFLEKSLTQKELTGLFNQSNCYVSLHKSEGFGLTLSEAMLLGKPVIATGYSGNLEFMNINNSFLVKYELEKLKENIGPFPKGGYWCNPDTDDAAKWMKYVYENYPQAIAIGIEGQREIQTNFSPEKIGEMMKERLKIIDSKFLKEDKNIFKKKVEILKFENNELKRKIETLKNYFPVKLKLSFKNFQNKITGKNRKYFWED